MRGVVLFLALAIASQLASAQRAGFVSGRLGAHPAHGFGSTHTGARPFPLYYPYGFWGFDSFDSFDSGYSVASQRPVVAQPSAPAAAPERPPADPLMIELQGDRYVQVGAADAKNNVPFLAVQPSTPPAKTPQQELRPVVLIFRDGHQEEVTDYTIANGVLYASANYYADGAWNKKIELTSVNIADTVATNQSRGVAFRLPASANEVITRP